MQSAFDLIGLDQRPEVYRRDTSGIRFSRPQSPRLIRFAAPSWRIVPQEGLHALLDDRLDLGARHQAFAVQSALQDVGFDQPTEVNAREIGVSPAQMASGHLPLDHGCEPPPVGIDEFCPQHGALAKSSLIAGAAGPAATLPIFDSGRLQGAYREKRAGYDAAVVTYDLTLTQALQEVADGVVSFRALDFADLETRAFTLDVALIRALGGGYRA